LGSSSEGADVRAGGAFFFRSSTHTDTPLLLLLYSFGRAANADLINAADPQRGAMFVPCSSQRQIKEQIQLKWRKRNKS
jgi:hypothetical protein